ncbi:NAD(P)-binding protein [Amniculicola lignicola CBS 123094]|uniref:NAD(P)-binding protein n=1 Tax=Amniculicola lignicola CBS 123094 TaxID=1392246 RepID=A0A6A5W825_9PLEO|nr:NAD(P)-binding protein [Amniculicola lignicola CBS 123094]
MEEVRVYPTTNHPFPPLSRSGPQSKHQTPSPPTMPPIRVALIGLSASAAVTWASDAHLPYLLSPLGRTHYTLVALLNSSLSAAQRAKSHYNLPASVKTYGDPKELAQDPNIDLVVCSTRVDVHFPVVEPSMRAGKAVYVEWPLTESLAKARELLNGKEYPDSIIGLQGRASPITLRLKSILASGAIGPVLSSNIQAFGNLLPRDSLPESLAYFTQREVGGHPINISSGHLLDFAHEVLGEWEGGFQSLMQIQRPSIRILDNEGKTARTVESSVPDLFAVHGTLKKGKANIVDGAVLSLTYHTGPQFPGTPGLIWTINGEKGELRLTAPGPYLMSDSYNGPIEILLHDFVTDEVKEMGWDWEEWQKELPERSRIVAQLYERYAHWVEGERPEVVEEGWEWPRLGDAVLRLEEFEEVFRQFDGRG